MFLSQQVKRKVIIANKNGKYELTYVLPTQGTSLIFIKILKELMQVKLIF